MYEAFNKAIRESRQEAGIEEGRSLERMLDDILKPFDEIVREERRWFPSLLLFEAAPARRSQVYRMPTRQPSAAGRKRPSVYPRFLDI